jgi:UDPglucose 6-dehydrogenase
MKIAVIGTGYVGLTTGVTLAYLGHRVTCVDVNEDKVKRLRDGILPIYEPGLEELLEASSERLHFTTYYEEAIVEAEAVFIAVGTPSSPDGSPDLSYLFASVERMLPILQDKATPTVIVNKSTAPVGTGDQIESMIRNVGLAGKVSVASNPEFLRQGQAVGDTLYPERIVVGGDAAARDLMARLYAGILDQTFVAPERTPRPTAFVKTSYIGVDRRSAELAKYAANAFLAMKISFINEMANVCDRVGSDVEEVASIIGLDRRIGPSFLKAGIGYGGSCFPKDTNALHHIANTNGYDFKLLSAVIEVNNTQKYVIVQKAMEELGGLQGRKLVVAGLAFKPGTDDLRDAPSIPIIHALRAEGALVYVHDPVAGHNARGILPDDVYLVDDLEAALRDAEALLLVTEWPQYVNLEPEYLRSVMKRPLLLDGRNAWSKDKRDQLEYVGIGTAKCLYAEPARAAR